MDRYGDRLGSLGLVASVTVLGTAFILTICSLAARMLATVHAKHEAGEAEGVLLAQVLAGASSPSPP